MRTKSILLGAAALAAGLVTSMAANVYSVNVVGYVNVNVSSNQYSLLENPLDDGAGDIITNVIQLNDNFDQTGTGGSQAVVLLLQGGHLNEAEVYYADFGWYPGT